MSTQPLLEVRDLSVSFETPAGPRHAVSGLSFSIVHGETLALVGESGCGKSSAALALLRLLPMGATSSGGVLLDGRNLLTLPEPGMRSVRGREVSMIFQEPMSSLNPVHRIGDQIAEVLRAHQHLSYRAALARAVELLDLVQLPEPSQRVKDYPHQLSGGQRQRVMIAMAVACGPRLLVADEPTTALDVTVQSQILALLERLRRELRMSLLLITHDLGVVAEYAERVVVMLDGRCVEEAPTQLLFEHPGHLYTRKLLQASLHCHPPESLGSAAIARPAAYLDSSSQSPAPPLLEVEQLVVSYPRSRSGRVNAVDGVSFSIATGETLGLIGESGCGKSTLARALMRLVPVRSGRLRFHGKDFGTLPERALAEFRTQAQMVFQDPYGSLNPRQSVGTILDTVLRVHRGGDASTRSRHIDSLIERVGLPLDSRRRYPNEFSGGQRQRIAIARALLLRPALLILDEPVSALDVSIQAQILDLLLELKRDFRLSYLFISHDLAVVRKMSDRIAVMQSGQLVETGINPALWDHPTHSYTRSLIAAAPRVRWKVPLDTDPAP